MESVNENHDNLDKFMSKNVDCTGKFIIHSKKIKLISKNIRELGANFNLELIIGNFKYKPKTRIFIKVTESRLFAQSDNSTLGTRNY